MALHKLYLYWQTMYRSYRARSFVLRTRIQKDGNVTWAVGSYGGALVDCNTHFGAMIPIDFLCVV